MTALLLLCAILFIIQTGVIWVMKIIAHIGGFHKYGWGIAQMYVEALDSLTNVDPTESNITIMFIENMVIVITYPIMWVIIMQYLLQ